MTGAPTASKGAMAGFSTSAAAGNLPISQLLGMAVDPRELHNYYEDVYQYIGLDSEPEDIEELFFRRYRQIRLNADPLLGELVAAIPRARHREYAGYFQGEVLYSLRCATTVSKVPDYKRLVFHTHPAAYAAADGPSSADLYQFLHKPNAVAITVGRDKCWVMVKTAATMTKVHELFLWKNEHMTRTMLDLHDLKYSDERIIKMAPDLFLEQAFSLAYPADKKERSMFDWETEVREKLGITLLVMHRNQD